MWGKNGREKKISAKVASPNREGCGNWEHGQCPGLQPLRPGNHNKSTAIYQHMVQAQTPSSRFNMEPRWTEYIKVHGGVVDHLLEACWGEHILSKIPGTRPHFCSGPGPAVRALRIRSNSCHCFTKEILKYTWPLHKAPKTKQPESRLRIKQQVAREACICNILLSRFATLLFLLGWSRGVNWRNPLIVAAICLAPSCNRLKSVRGWNLWWSAWPHQLDCQRVRLQTPTMLEVPVPEDPKKNLSTIHRF